VRRVRYTVKRRWWAIIGAVVALALAGGMIVQRGPAESPVLTTVAVGPSPSAVVVDARARHAFVLDGDDTVSMLDTRTGNLLRTVPVGKAAMALAVDERVGRVYVVNSYMSSGGQGTMTVLDAASGTIIATTPAGNVPYAVAVDEQSGHVFVLSASITGSVIMLDAVNGHMLKAIDAGANGGPLLGVQVLTVDAHAGRGFAIVSNDVTVGPQVTMFDTRQGLPLGVVKIGLSPFTVVADAQNKRIFASNEGDLAIVDEQTGRVSRLRVPFSTFRVPFSTFIIVDARSGRVFRAGRVRAGYEVADMLDARTGHVIRSIPLAIPMSAIGAATVDAHSGRLIVVSDGRMNGPGSFIGSGSVTVVDVPSSISHRVSVGVHPVAVAVDERTGHVFVVNGGGVVRDADRWGWLPGWLHDKLPFLPPPGLHTRTVPGSVSVIDLSRL